MKGRLILLAVWLLIVSLAFSACAPLPTDNPFNPSYRLITSQILEIDSALGTSMEARGGLTALVSRAQPDWTKIGEKVTIIENAWDDVRSELRRRQIEETGAAWNTWYSQYYRIMATIDSFEMSLITVKNDVSTKQRARITGSVMMLSEAFMEIKSELGSADVDGRRVTFVALGFVAILATLAVSSSVIARRRDSKFMLPRRTGRPS